MILSVHQPQYIPWLGYFHKIAHSDLFVLLDDVQYKKREFQNRNKIRTKEGFIWLTVPVITKGRYYQKISEVEIDNTTDWGLEHLKSIRLNYSKSEYYNLYIDFFEKLYKINWEYLCELNVETVKFILKELGINTPIEFSSKLKLESTSTQRIIDICKHFGADTYLSGAGGRDYLDESAFEKNGIKVVYQDFKHPQYKQIYDGFEPFMSSIDLLFNCGPESGAIIKNVK